MTTQTRSPRRRTRTTPPKYLAPRLNPAWLKHHREQHGISLRQLAKRGRISAPTLCIMEQGRGNVTPRMARAYRSVLPGGKL